MGLERMTASAKVATILSSIPASPDIEKTVGAAYESVLNKVQAQKMIPVYESKKDCIFLLTLVRIALWAPRCRMA
jgi:hypothetical protein